MTACNKFLDDVDYVSGFAISWEIKLGTDAEWTGAGSSSNTVNEWFDPSYGVKYVGATKALLERDFDDNYLAGYLQHKVVLVKESVIDVDVDGNGNKTGNVMWGVSIVRKNVNGTTEVIAEIT